ncbi:hypothetical protein N9Y92_04240, partial [Chlamydiales bacterium]|nr:hypothetical protein [Chlamydiales bacterium]
MEFAIITPMSKIHYIDRKTKETKEEIVYGGGFVSLLYGTTFISQTLGASLRWLSANFSLVSVIYGFWQKRAWTKKKIPLFIKEFNVDASEFLDPVSSFSSFNDF